MTLFFPDINLWIALSSEVHSHKAEAWEWLGQMQGGLAFSRYTQLGLLRLLTNPAVMQGNVLRLREAWNVYDQWIDDPRVDFYPEPRNVDIAFREATTPYDGSMATKWIGDCYLIAFAKEHGATLVTFDNALRKAAQKAGCAAITPR